MQRHTRPKQTDLKRLFLDLWKQESDDITDGTGSWSGVPTEKRLFALRGVRSLVNRTLTAIDLMEGGQENGYC